MNGLAATRGHFSFGTNGDTRPPCSYECRACCDASTTVNVCIWDGKRSEVPDEHLGVAILGTFRREPASTLRLYEALHPTGSALVPVYLDDGVICVGPVFLPGQPPCPRCYEERLVQHDPAPSYAQARAELFDRSTSPSNHPLAAVLAFVIGAAATSLPRAIEARDVHAGDIFRYPTVGAGSRRGRVVAVDGCPRCWRGSIRRSDKRLLNALARRQK